MLQIGFEFSAILKCDSIISREKVINDLLSNTFSDNTMRFLYATGIEEEP